MLRALIRRFRRPAVDPTQLGLAFDVQAPRDARELLERLRSFGLRRIESCELTHNRQVMVSFRGPVLRVHEGYLDAPESVLRAIARFVEGRTRTDRREARRLIVSHRIGGAPVAGRRRAERTHPDDQPFVARLELAHAELNRTRFGGELKPIPVRVSRRMRSRLGHYMPPSNGAGGEIAISQRHIRRHGWDEALETLVHEMVHQWQVETNRPLDHGREFRRKAREVGAAPRATRAPGGLGGVKKER